MSDSRLAEALELLGAGTRWTQGLFNDGHGRHCAVGALRRVHGMGQSYFDSHSYMEDLWELDKVAQEQYHRSGIVGLNDYYHTTFADVERVFEKAIVRRQEEV